MLSVSVQVKVTQENSTYMQTCSHDELIFLLDLQDVWCSTEVCMSVQAMYNEVRSETTSTWCHKLIGYIIESVLLVC